MKDLIDLTAKTIRNAVAQGKLTPPERLGLLVLYCDIERAAYDSNQPQEVREYAAMQLATLPFPPHC